MKNLIVGALVSHAANGVDPVDGCSSIYKDGNFIYSCAEERITRKKYCGGFVNSLASGLRTYGLKVSDVEAFVFASYGEPIPVGKQHLRKQLSAIGEVPDSKIFMTPSHHELHAIQSFRNSDYKEAIIIVADNEGLILGPEKHSPPLLNPMERTSVYIGSAGGVQLLMRYHDNFSDASFGEAYRKFTYFLGFPSHQFAGKTMALSSYGKLQALKDKRLYTCTKYGDLVTSLSNEDEDPVRSVMQWIKAQNLDNYYPKKKGEEFNEGHFELAAFIQREIEENFISIIKRFATKYRINNVCIGGGLAYNCQLISSIERQTGLNVFVPPCPGDQGISEGAVLWCLENIFGEKKHIPPKAYLGSPAMLDTVTLDRIKANSKLTITAGFEREVAQRVAHLLSMNKIIGLCVGKAESGRRALGNRSIICSIADGNTIERVRRLKNREFFRPFGASFLDNPDHTFFDSPYPDEYMLRASPVNSNFRARLKPVTHVDGTIRAQSIKPNSDVFLRHVLECLPAFNLDPIVLNTSFNFDGEPIIDSCGQAFDWFEMRDLDALVLPGFLIEKK